LDLLHKTNMQCANSIATPMGGGEKLYPFGSNLFSDPQLYRQVVGALQYVTITRPELSYAVNRVCQFMHQPLESHWKVVKRILRYLKGTIDFGLHLQKDSNLSLVGYCDADWASDPNDRRSTSGFGVYLGPNLISWSSKKQPTVSRSSSEAEYRSLANVTAEVLWLQSLLSELHYSSNSSPLLYCDNISTILMAENPVFHARTKHIEIDLHFVREKVQSQEIRIQHVNSAAQIADIFTKALPSSQFLNLREKLRVDIPRPLSVSEGSIRESVQVTVV
jgi:hypothetical protein